jgi:hypothetical protein
MRLHGGFNSSRRQLRPHVTARMLGALRKHQVPDAQVIGRLVFGEHDAITFPDHTVLQPECRTAR